MKQMGHAAALAVVLLTLVVPSPATAPPRIPPPPIDAATWAVVRVVDGDTVIVRRDDTTETVRLIGVDTPETKHPSKPVEFYGREASRFLHNLLAGEQVRLVYQDGDRTDRYGRTLAYLYRIPEQLFVNLEIVRQGYGHAYTRFPFEHRDVFVEYERLAREDERGLWNTGFASEWTGEPAGRPGTTGR
ncbi:MAG: thermonuclease family protein [Planctomycetota bacterium]|jgi:micrococcal nuclease